MRQVNAVEQVTVLLRQHQGPAIGRIDVQPQAIFAHHRANPRQIVNCTEHRGAGRCHHTKRVFAECALLGNRLTHRLAL